MDSCGSYFVPVPKGGGRIFLGDIFNSRDGLLMYGNDGLGDANNGKKGLFGDIQGKLFFLRYLF